jgi:hypothetical protein
MISTKKMKNLFQVFPKILTKHQAKAGTTILETLTAGMMTVMLVAAAGSGVASIIGNDYSIKSNSKTQQELKSILNYIDQELKQGQTIKVGGNINHTVASMSAEAAAAFKAAAGDHDYSVLLVQIPNVAAPMVYYLDSPPEGSNLDGPKVVYRWGAKVGVDGKYTNLDDPTSWTAEPIMDKITDKALPQDFSCETDWQFSPTNSGESSVSATGFYACINPEGKIANMFLNAKMINIHGTGETYEKNSKLIAQAEELSPIGGSPPPLDAEPTVCDIDAINGHGQLRCNKAATIAFKEIAKIEFDFDGGFNTTPNESVPGYENSFSVTYEQDGNESKKGTYNIDPAIVGDGPFVLKLKAGSSKSNSKSKSNSDGETDYYFLANPPFNGNWSTIEDLGGKGISHISLYIPDNN